MGFCILIFLVALAEFGRSNPAVLPVEKCALSDSKCMQKSFQDALPIFMPGLPEVGTESLDIMDMENVAFDLAGLQFTLTDGKLKGLKNSIIDKVKWDSNKKKIEIKYHVNCTVKGHYTAGGRVLILPITGDGQIKLKMKNLAVRLFMDYDIKPNPEGKDAVVPNKYGFEFEVKDGAHFDLSNLFNGNKELSDAMLRFLNDNWREVTSEFGRPIMEVAAKKIFKNVVKYLSSVPVEDITVVNA